MSATTMLIDVVLGEARYLVMIGSVVLLLTWLALQYQGRLTQKSASHQLSSGKLAVPYQDIEQMQDFTLDEKEPIQLRPFKPRYHLTMGKACWL